MKFIDKNSKVAKFQAGGQMAPTPNPAPQQDPMMAQIEQLAAQLLQELGPEGALMLAEVIMAMAQSAAQPVGPAEGAPVFKVGGKLVKRVK